jgi:hypothetical protein
MKAVHDLLATGVKRISAHQLMLLHGAPLSNPDSRERFGFQTRFRVVARNLGDYTGEPVVEVEEMVVETPTFSFQDYLETRVFHLLLTIFYYEGNFEEAFELARQHTVGPYDLIVRMQAMLDQAPARFRGLIADFVRESQEELFYTKEECIRWARENFDGLVSGELGGNLLSKYSMLGRFYVLHEALDFLGAGITTAAREVGADPDPDVVRTVMDYLGCIMLHVPFRESLAATSEWTTWFDVEAWRREGYTRRLAEYRFETPRLFLTAVEGQRKTLIETKVETFGEHPSGLGKFTRTMFAQDLRRTPVRSKAVVESAAEAAV